MTNHSFQFPKIYGVNQSLEIRFVSLKLHYLTERHEEEVKKDTQYV